MSGAPLNVVANLVGRGWSGVISFLVVPLYIRFLGIESYGLVGAFATLQVVMSVFDLGLNATVNRELARYSSSPGRLAEMRDLVRTMELIYWAVAVVVGALVVSLAGPLATHWFRPKTLSTETVKQAVTVMGVVLSLQWPFAFYSGGLIGLQRQVAYNAILAGTSTLRAVGAILVLLFISPTIQAFFWWQAVSSGMQTLVAAGTLWRFLKTRNHVPAFRRELLNGVYRFSGGVAAISVVTLLLTQADKIVVSKILPLDAFGYYALASTVAGTVYILITPIFTAYFPEFVRLVAAGTVKELGSTYHRACQLMSVIVLPAALVLAFFSRDLLLIWTRNPVTADRTHVIVTILVLGTALNGLMNVPYALQLAYGWTRLTLYSNLVAVAVLVPAMLLTVPRFGAAGAASTWLVLNAGYVLITLPLMHRRILKGELRYWFVHDLGLPLSASITIVATGRAVIADGWRSDSLIVAVGFVSVLALWAAAFAAPGVRRWTLRQIAAVRGHTSRPEDGPEC